MILRPLKATDESQVLALPAKSIDFFFVGREHAGTFSEYCEALSNWENGLNLPPRFVRSAFRVAEISGQIVGRVSVRYELNDFLNEYGGHIGYQTFPAFEGRGYATRMLSQTLDLLWQDDHFNKALVTCSPENPASRRVIEKCGGIYQKTVHSDVMNETVHHFLIEKPTRADQRPKG